MLARSPIALRSSRSLSSVAKDDRSIPAGRVRRTAQVGSVIGTQGARYAGTRAANVARTQKRAHEQLDRRHLEAAERRVDTPGTMTAAAMRNGRLACFIATAFLAEADRGRGQDHAGRL